MIEEGMILPLSILELHKKVYISEPTVMLVRCCENKDVILSVTGDDAKVNEWRITQDAIIIMSRVKVMAQGNTFAYRKLKIDVFAKLLAFIEMPTDAVNSGAQHSCFSTTHFDDVSAFYDQNSAEKWFLMAYLQNSEWFQSLRQMLRKTETYGIVRYLLSETISSSTLHELCKPYGLSYSHFRRICRNALGGKVKEELCHWRLARAILDILAGKSDITTIAHKYGYSSSSHFSSEVKNVMGKTLREMRHRLDAFKRNEEN